MVLCKINKNITKIIILFIVALFFFSCNVTKHLNDSEKLLVKNDVKIDEKNDIKKDEGLNVYEINQIIKPEPNSKIFGIPFNLKLYYLIDVKKREKFVEGKNKKCNERKNSKISNINQKIKKFDKKKTNDSTHYSSNLKWNRKMAELENKKEKIKDKACDRFKRIKNLGEMPVLYRVGDEFRNKRKLSILLKNYGYYDSRVIISSKTKKHNNKKIVVTYQIYPGEPHIIDHINYNIDDSTISDLIIADTTNCEIKPGRRFDIKLLEAERERISEYLKNKGYYKFTQDYIFFSIDTIGKQFLTDITVNITNPKNEYGETLKHKKYKIHEVYIYPNFKPALALKERENYFLKNDTIIFYTKKNQKYNFIYNDIQNINPQTIARSLYVAPDKYFTLNDINATYRYLASLQLITITNIQLIERENDRSTNDTLPEKIDCEIRLTQDSIQSYEVAAEVTNTSGNMGIQGNLRYKNNNVFRNADVLDLKLNFAIKSIQPDDSIDTDGFFNSFEYGFDLGLNFPRLLAPVPLKKFIKRSNPKTTFNIKYNKLKQPDYSTSIAGISYGYFWYSTNTIYNDFKPITGDFVKVMDVDSSFFVDIIVKYNLQENYKSHFVFGSSYRFSFNNQLFTQRNNFFNVTANIKLTGNTLSTVNRWLKSPTVNGSYEVAGNPFSQFIKTDVDIRYYRKLKRENDKLVFRFFGGMAYPYGNLNVIPFSEQYFSGGANGIRAWLERSLGPGSNPEVSDKTYADIKLEGNFEYRMKLFGQFEGALFLDAGNIWAINKEDNRPGALFETKDFYKEIALGSGFGIRWDLTIVIIRLDFGIKVFDPALPVNRRLIYSFDTYSASDFNLQFGIGYPF